MAGVGAFGKMPGMGDFFRFNLPQAFVEPWDAWLIGLLTVGREALGERWQEAYMSAPIWRFSLSPGQMGPDGLLGIMMPSVDRVGRQFPLTLAVPLPSGTAALDAHFANADTFAALESVALDALDNDLSREALAPYLADVDLDLPEPLTSSAAEEGVLRAAGPEVVPALMAALIAPGFRAPSVWTADLEGDGRVLVVEGLPKGRDLPGFFDLSQPAPSSPQDDPISALLA